MHIGVHFSVLVIFLSMICTQEARQSVLKMAINKEDLSNITNKMIMMDALKRIGMGEPSQNKYIVVRSKYSPGILALGIYFYQARNHLIVQSLLVVVIVSHGPHFKSK